VGAGRAAAAGQEDARGAARHHRRLVIEAVLYLLDNGVKRRSLPKGFPPKSTVYDYVARWRDDGTWPRVHDALRDQARAAIGKADGPTAAIIDSKSAKTTEKGATGASTPTSGYGGTSGTRRSTPTGSCCCRT
jgi:transposase